MSEQLIKDLKEVIQNRDAVLFIGSGVSIATTGGWEAQPAASWIGLLKNGVEFVEHTGIQTDKGRLERVIQDIESDDLDDLLAGAHKIEQWIRKAGSGEFRKWLKGSIGKLTVQSPTLIENLAALKLPIVTTNYDSLLEEIIGFQYVTWMESAKTQEAIRDHSSRKIVHLHGYYEDPESVILDPTGYGKIIAHGHSQALLRALQATKSIIFIGLGAGLEDPNFSRFREWAASLFSDSMYRHYRLCLNSEVEKLKHVHHPGERVKLVPYGDAHDHLPAFLESLVENGGPISPAQGTTHSPKSTQYHFIPPPPTMFGRDELLTNTVSRLLASPRKPLAVRGGMGVGKTNLSLNIIHDPQIKRRYHTNRIYIACDAITSGSELLVAMASKLDIEISQRVEERLRAHFSSGEHLLVLDNFETLFNANPTDSEEVLQLIFSWGELCLLIGIRGFEKPVGLPWQDPVNLEPLSNQSSRDMFLGNAGIKFKDDPDLDYLLQRMDGLPLALSLLAVEADGLGNLGGLKRRWDQQRTKLLELRPEKKELNFSTSLELSIQSRRMDEAAKCLLFLVAYLPEGISEDDLEGCFTDRPWDSLSRLRRSGMVKNTPDRLDLLAPIREYIESHYPPCPDSFESAKNYFLQKATEWGRKILTSEGEVAAQKITAEFANLEKIIRSEIWHGRGGGAALALGEYILSSGIKKEGLLQDIELMAKETGDEEIRANCIKRMGNIALHRSEHERAEELFNQAIPIFQKLGDLPGEANCIQRLGDIALRRSEHERAGELFNQAIPMYQKLGSLHGEANCIYSLGEIALVRSEHERAEELFNQAIPMYQKLGSLHGVANCIYSLGEIAFHRWEHERAEELFNQAIPMYQKLGSLLGEANCIRSLGLFQIESNGSKAKSLFEAALEKYYTIGDLYSVAGTKVYLTKAVTSPEERSLLIDEAVEIFQKIQLPEMVVWARNYWK